MHTIHIFHAIHKIFKIRSELHEVYLNQIIRTFATALINVFIPIYLLSIGFSLQIALLYYLVVYSVMGLLSPFASSIASKIGLKHSVLFITPVMVIYFLMLIIMPFIDAINNIWFLSLIALLSGLSSVIYWNSINSEFVKNSHKIHSAEETSHMMGFPKLAMIFAPAIGGLVTEFMGFDPLFVIVMVLLMVSVAPLFATADYKKKFKFKLRFFRILINKKFSILHFSRGVTDIIESIIWPVYIYIVFSDILTVGIAFSITAFAIVLFTLFIGKVSDKIGRKKLLRIGGIGLIFSWISAIFVTSMLEIFLLSFLIGIFGTLMRLSIFANFSDFARVRNILANVANRESWLCIGRVAILIVLILVLVNFQIAFVIAALVSVVFLAL